MLADGLFERFPAPQIVFGQHVGPLFPPERRLRAGTADGRRGLGASDLVRPRWSRVTAGERC